MESVLRAPARDVGLESGLESSSRRDLRGFLEGVLDAAAWVHPLYSEKVRALVV